MNSQPYAHQPAWPVARDLVAPNPAETQVWLAETQEHVNADDSLWGGKSRDFDWGD